VPRTVVIVQARTGSTRLPGKVLELVGDRPMLDLVLDRALAVPGVDAVAVATSVLPGDDAVEALAVARGVAVVRGSEQDVLERYATAAEQLQAGIVVRITADCPLLDPQVVGRMLALRAAGRLDYAAVMTGAAPPRPGLRRFPHGLDAEAFTGAALAAAAREATEDYDHEHVTPFIKQRPERFAQESLYPDEAEGDLGAERWTVDHPADLELVRAIVARLPSPTASYREILAVLDADPALRRINAAAR
jgi:spore coat polysaccharide biosynthesis protein SpsF (cytidylyltransferase family)